MVKTILLIDDSADFREIFSLKLKAAGFAIETAENGAEALEKLKTARPGLVLLDMEMPVMNGAEMLTKLRADAALKDLKVAFLDNLGDPKQESAESDEKFARDSGAVSYLRKTDDLDSITAKIQKIIDR